MAELTLPPRLAKLLKLELGQDASGFLISTIKDLATKKLAEYTHESQNLRQKYQSSLTALRRQVKKGVGMTWEEHEKAFDLHYWKILQTKIVRWKEILTLCGK